MNHKQLLALFLCFVIVLSSKIVATHNSKEVVAVKSIASNVDEISIENIYEEKDGYKIDVFYPVTKYDFVNSKVNDVVDEAVKEARNTKKNLKISFETYNNEELTTIKLLVYKDSQIKHDHEKVYTISYNDDEIIPFDKLINQDKIGTIKEYVKNYLKNNEKYKEWYAENIVESKIDNLKELNYIITNNSIILLFNPNELLPNVAGIIQIEIPFEILQINID